MLEQIKRNPALLLYGDNLTVKQRTDWQLLTSTGDMRELSREEITPTRPERYPVLVSPS